MALTRLSNQSLTSISSLPAAISTGKVLQVVTATDDTVRTTTSTSFVSGSLSVNITPSSSSNKVFVMTSGTCYYDGTNKRYRVTIYRDSTNLDAAGNSTGNGLIQGFTSGGNIVGSMNMNILDTPSTSSQITYAVYFRADDTGGNTAYLGEYNVRKSITAFEIAG